MINGIIFDFNGTLFFDTDLQAEAWRVLLRKYEHREVSDEEFACLFHGRTNEAICENFKSIDKQQSWQLALEKEVTYRQLCRDNSERLHLVKGATELFELLRERGIPFTIATASEISNVRFFFETFDLERWFSWERFIYDDGTFPGKPAPDIYLRACAAIERLPQNCIVVEDSLSGIHAAEAAGIGRVIAMDPQIDAAEIKSDPQVYAVIKDYCDFSEKYL